MPNIIIIDVPTAYITAVWVMAITLVVWGLVSMVLQVWDFWSRHQWDEPFKLVADETYKTQHVQTPHIGDFLSSAEREKHTTPKSMARIRGEKRDAFAAIQWQLVQVRKMRERQAKGNGA